MPSNFNNQELTEIKFNGVDVSEAYFNNVLVFNSSFVSTWRTTTANETITLPTSTNYEVEWGDETVTTDANSHTYAIDGDYEIKIRGSITDFAFNNGGDKDKILEVSNFGGLFIADNAFYGCDLVNITATDIPILNIDLNDIFQGAASLIFNSSINNWDTSSVTILRSSFSRSSFNQDISNWNVENVENLENLVSFNTQFNQPLNSWNTISLTSFFSAFNGCTSFNQDLDNWDVSRCSNLASLFFNAVSFNGNISTWDVSNVTLFNDLFNNAESFNGELNGWITTSLTNLTQTFRDTDTFNKPLNNWYTSNVTSMAFCFRSAFSFNQDISDWSFVSVTNMSGFMQLKTENDYNANYLSDLLIKLDQDLVFANMVNVNLGFGTIKYDSTGVTAYNSLVSKGFIIQSGGQV